MLTAAAGAGLIIAALATLAMTSHPSQPSSINPDAATSLAAEAPAAHTPGRSHAQADPSARPDRLVIASLGIDAHVVPIGVTARGELAIPADVHNLGWYQYGPSPGAPAGSIVIAGHVDSATQGIGALFPLRTIEAGAVITVTTTDERQWDYRVISRQDYPKPVLPLAALFSPAGAPRLTLLTCGGPFDHNTRSYLDNLVVTAVPTQ